MSELIPPGQYQATLQKIEVAAAKSGIPQAILTFSIDGHIRRVYLSLSEKAFKYSQASLATVGFNGDFAAPAFSNPGPHVLDCTNEEYEGKQTERWQFPRGPRELPKPIGSDLAMQLSARYRATVQQPTPGTQTPPFRVDAPPAVPPPVAPAPRETWTKMIAYEKWSKSGEPIDLAVWTSTISKYLTEKNLPDEGKIDSAGWEEIYTRLTTPF